jgi:nucleotide-binding universal stress UspA family protein
VTIRRVIVGLDPRSPGRAALEAAAQLAERLQAELVGLFVEDVDLLHLAGLPFAREIGFPSATLRALDVTSMERSLRALAGEVQRTMALIVGRAPVPWSFRVARGVLMSELRAAAAEGDIVVTGALRLSLPAPLSVLCSVATPPEQVVPAAAALARSLGGEVEIVLLDGDSAAAKRWERAARRLLAVQGSGLRLRAVPAESRNGRKEGSSTSGDR